MRWLDKLAPSLAECLLLLFLGSGLDLVFGDFPVYGSSWKSNAKAMKHNETAMTRQQWKTMEKQRTGIEIRRHKHRHKLASE